MYILFLILIPFLVLIIIIGSFAEDNMALKSKIFSQEPGIIQALMWIKLVFSILFTISNLINKNFMIILQSGYKKFLLWLIHYAFYFIHILASIYLIYNS